MLSKLFEGFVSIGVQQGEKKGESCVFFVWFYCGSLWGCHTAGCWQIHSTAQTNSEEKEQLMAIWKAFLCLSELNTYIRDKTQDQTEHGNPPLLKC